MRRSTLAGGFRASSCSPEATVYAAAEGLDSSFALATSCWEKNHHYYNEKNNNPTKIRPRPAEPGEHKQKKNSLARHAGELVHLPSGGKQLQLCSRRVFLTLGGETSAVALGVRSFPQCDEKRHTWMTAMRGLQKIATRQVTPVSRAHKQQLYQLAIPANWSTTSRYHWGTTGDR